MPVRFKRNKESRKIIGDLLENSDRIKHGSTIPRKVYDLMVHLAKKKSPPPGYKGGTIFKNDGRNNSAMLPGNTKYKKYDVNPLDKGARDLERIVIGEDGTTYYTDDHYFTFHKIK
jgi:guanyl-specific ribonuclease Sa